MRGHPAVQYRTWLEKGSRGALCCWCRRVSVGSPVPIVFRWSKQTVLNELVLTTSGHFHLLLKITIVRFQKCLRLVGVRRGELGSYSAIPDQ
jgi:hypothetical protein